MLSEAVSVFLCFYFSVRRMSCCSSHVFSNCVSLQLIMYMIVDIGITIMPGQTSQTFMPECCHEFCWWQCSKNQEADCTLRCGSAHSAMSNYVGTVQKSKVLVQTHDIVGRGIPRTPLTALLTPLHTPSSPSLAVTPVTS